MKESRFIAQNKEKWLEFERCLEKKDTDPEKISRLFVQITDDLAYSRTFYKNRSVRAYLNGLARNIFIGIYKNKKNNKSKLKDFWLNELPWLIFESRKELLLSFLIFAVSFAMGIFSSMNEVDYARQILGDQYVEMTIENIRNEDPMAVYKKMNNVDMFFGITLNNIFVAFKTFLFGIFMAIGTIGILLYNGIMVGTFQYFFVERGIFKESFLTIWQHGTLEISAIIIAGAAGITLGKGLLFPGTFSRFQSLQMSAKRSLKIMLGISPIIVLAAFIEGFFTRYTNAPDIIRITTIAASLFFIVYYFIWYPYLLSKKGKSSPNKAAKPVVGISWVFEPGQIYSSDGVFSFSFQFIKKKLGKISVFMVLSGIVYTFLVFFFIKDTFMGLGATARIHELFNYGENRFLYLLNTFVFAAAMLFFQNMLFSKKKYSLPKYLIEFGSNFIVLGLMNALFYLGMGWGATLVLMILPIIMQVLMIQSIENTDIFKASNMFRILSRGTMKKVMGTYIRMLVIWMVFVYLFNTPTIWRILEILNWGFYFTESARMDVFLAISLFVNTCMMLALICFMAVSKGLLYYTLKEIQSASNLKQKVSIIINRREKQT